MITKRGLDPRARAMASAQKYIEYLEGLMGSNAPQPIAASPGPEATVPEVDEMVVNDGEGGLEVVKAKKCKKCLGSGKVRVGLAPSPSVLFPRPLS